MNITDYMNQKLIAALKGEETGINFPYLNRIRKETEAQKIVRKLSGN
jgi:hypothetical protein